MKKITEKAAYSRAATACAAAELCAFDVERKLLRWGVAPAVAEGIVGRLRSEGFIDEERFCRAFVHDKLYFNHWGRVKISYMLSAKRVNTAVARNAVSAINEDDYAGILEDFLSSRLRLLSASDDTASRRRRLAQAAQARGFESYLVFEWIERHLPDIEQGAAESE